MTARNRATRLLRRLLHLDPPQDMLDLALYVTRHATEKLRDRYGIADPHRAAYEARIYGTPRTKLQGPIRAYLDRKAASGSPCHYLVHQGSVWVWDGMRLVTVYPVPSDDTINRYLKGANRD